MESTYRLEKTANGIVPNKEQATMPEMCEGLFAQAKELFGETAAVERFCAAGSSRPHLGTLLPMSAAIGAHLDRHGNKAMATADGAKQSVRTSKQDGETWLNYYRRDCSLKGAQPAASLEKIYSDMDSGAVSTATKSKAKTFPDHVAVKVKGGMSKGAAVVACAKEFSESHRDWLMNGQKPPL